MIDATLSEAVILRSVRKFFIDLFPEETVYFEFVDREPKDSSGVVIPRWLCIVPFGRVQSTLAYADMQIQMFVKGAAMGEVSATFRDEIIDALIDLTQTDGCKRVNCYDSDWAFQFTARLSVLDDLDFTPFSDGLSLRIIPFRLHWGAK